jgi:hypothetical protein
VKSAIGGTKTSLTTSSPSSNTELPTINLSPKKPKTYKEKVKAISSHLGILQKPFEIMASPITTVVLGTTLATLVNPVGAGTLVKSVSSKVLTTAIAHPIPVVASALVGVPLVVGVIATKPSLLIDLPKKAFKTGEELVNVVEEHPVATAVLGGVTGGVLLYEGGKAIFGNGGEKTKEKEDKMVALGETPEVVKTGTSGTTSSDLGVPELAPERETTSIMPSKKRRRHPTIKEKPSMVQSLRVNILNRNSANRITKTYLNRELVYN